MQASPHSWVAAPADAVHAAQMLLPRFSVAVAVRSLFLNGRTSHAVVLMIDLLSEDPRVVVGPPQGRRSDAPVAPVSALVPHWCCGPACGGEVRPHLRRRPGLRTDWQLGL